MPVSKWKSKRELILLITLTNQVDRWRAWSSRTPLPAPLCSTSVFLTFLCFALDLFHLLYALILVFQAGKHCFESQRTAKSRPERAQRPGSFIWKAEMMNRVVKKTRCRVPLVLLFIPWFRSVSDGKKLFFVSQRNQLCILILKF